MTSIVADVFVHGVGAASPEVVHFLCKYGLMGHPNQCRLSVQKNYTKDIKLCKHLTIRLKVISFGYYTLS